MQIINMITPLTRYQNFSSGVIFCKYSSHSLTAGEGVVSGMHDFFFCRFCITSHILICIESNL